MFKSLFTTPLNSRRFGKNQERRAESFLRRHGLRAIARNFSWQGGELDLVMLDKHHTLVFVEVRYRSNLSHGSSLQSVTARKQARVRNSAARFLQLHPRFRAYPCRFDVVGIAPGNGGRCPTFHWVRGAFH